MTIPFCDSGGFGPTTDDGVITNCFSYLVFGALPVVFLACTGMARLMQLAVLPRVMSPLACRLGAKAFLSIMMYLFPVGFALLDLSSSVNLFTVARIIHDLVKSVAWMLAIYILWREFRHAVNNNYVLRCWWVMEFVAVIVAVASSSHNDNSFGTTFLRVLYVITAGALATFALFPRNTDTRDGLPLFPGPKRKARTKMFAWAMRPTRSGYSKVTLLSEGDPTAMLLEGEEEGDERGSDSDDDGGDRFPAAGGGLQGLAVPRTRSLSRHTSQAAEAEAAALAQAAREEGARPTSATAKILASSAAQLRVAVMRWELPAGWRKGSTATQLPPGLTVGDGVHSAVFTVKVSHTPQGGAQASVWEVKRSTRDLSRLASLLSHYHDQRLVQSRRPPSWVVPTFPSLPRGHAVLVPRLVRAGDATGATGRPRSDSDSSADSTSSWRHADPRSQGLASKASSTQLGDLSISLQLLRARVDVFLGKVVAEPALCRTRLLAAFLSPQVGPRAFEQTGSESDRISAVVTKFSGIDTSTEAQRQRAEELEARMLQLKLPPAACQRFRARLRRVEEMAAAKYNSAEGEGEGEGGAREGSEAAAQAKLEQWMAPKIAPPPAPAGKAKATTEAKDEDVAAVQAVQTHEDEDEDDEVKGGDAAGEATAAVKDEADGSEEVAAEQAQPKKQAAATAQTGSGSGSGSAVSAAAAEVKPPRAPAKPAAATKSKAAAGDIAAGSMADVLLSLDGPAVPIASPFGFGFQSINSVDLDLKFHVDGNAGGGLSLASDRTRTAAAGGARAAIADARRTIKNRRKWRSGNSGPCSTHEGRISVACRMAGMSGHVIGGKANGGVELVSHTVRLRTLNNCFSGAQAVEWLMDNQLAGSRKEAATVAQLLLNSDVIVFAHRLLIHGATGSGAGMQSLPFNDVASLTFQDNELCLYQFGDVIVPQDTPGLARSSSSSTSVAKTFELAEVLVGGRRASVSASQASSEWFQGDVTVRLSLVPPSADGVTRYKIHVTAEHVAWEVCKRYSEFRALRRQLRDDAPDTELPEFPAKQRMATMFQSVSVEERRALLEAFLRAVVKMPSCQTLALACFIDPVLDEQLHKALPSLDTPSNPAANSLDHVMGFMD